MSRVTSPVSAQPVPQRSLFGTAARPPTEPTTTITPSLLTSAAIVKQEANLLRFPFFALGRKGLRNHKGLLIRGQSKLDGQNYDFEYRITCNSDDLYPGQLSRKVHMGLLRIMQRKQAFPFANPIEFTWRELMETIGVVASGRTQQQLKQAIRSIEGTRIRSKFALKNAHGKHLKGRERGYGLYSEYVFFDELMPDNKTVADKSFCGWPTGIWPTSIRSIARRSTTDCGCGSTTPVRSPAGCTNSSRSISPATGRRLRSITTSCSLPSRGPRKALVANQEATRQGSRPCRRCRRPGRVRNGNFGKHGQPQLAVRRGRLLAKRGLTAESAAQPDELEATEIRELYRQARPEDELVCQFHALWDGNDQYHPTSTDRARAKQIITAYGQQKAEQLLPTVVELVRERFPKAKSFGATNRYWFEAAAELEKHERAGERRKQEFVAEQLEEAHRRQQRDTQERFEERWNQLPPAEQQAIRDHVLASHPRSMKLEKIPNTFHRFCLQELAKREQE